MITARFAVISLAALFALLFRCSQLTGGAGGETTNGYVQGFLFNDDGSPAVSARVSLMPVDYNPVTDQPVPDSLTATVGPAGNYSLATSSGMYTIQAVNVTLHTSVLITGIGIAKKDTVFVPPRTLRTPGAVKAMLPDSVNAQSGYVFVPGTDIFTFLSGNDSVAILDYVPAGNISVLSYAVANSAVERILRYNIQVPSGDTVVIFNTAWKYSQQLVLNTAVTGAGVQGNVMSFPVLVRLSAGNFNFAEAKAAGADLRFTKPDNTPLQYEIERWDAPQARAEIWVNVDTVFGSNDSQHIDMYWGNPAAPVSSSGISVFDTSAGFQGVWHLSETQGALTHDATANQFSGLPSAAAPASAPGAVGQGLFFSGINSYITITGTETGRLNFPAHATYSLSAWVYADTLDSTWQNIVGKGNTQYHMQIWGHNEWLFTEYEDQGGCGWESTKAPATSRTWVHVAGVRDGYNEYLYVNGSCVDSVPELAPFTDSTRYLGNPVTIGCATRKDPQLEYFFKGTIDEVRIQNRALNPDWVRLCYMNQKAMDALVKINNR
jgi:hypothetical protein